MLATHLFLLPDLLRVLAIVVTAVVTAKSIVGLKMIFIVNKKSLLFRDNKHASINTYFYQFLFKVLVAAYVIIGLGHHIGHDTITYRPFLATTAFICLYLSDRKSLQFQKERINWMQTHNPENILETEVNE